MAKLQTINFADDLGNGSLKGIINGDEIKIPSNIAPERPQDIHDPIQFSNKRSMNAYLEHYLDHMDVSVDSPTVKTKGRFLAGSNAVLSDLNTEGFDVSDYSGKATTDLAVIITLSTIASKAVENQYKATGKIPTGDLYVHVNMVTSLPIVEGSRNNTRNMYRDRYLRHNHIVSIYNFGSPLNVHIHFNHCGVLLEGESAIYAIHHADPELRREIFSDLKEHYPDLAKGVTSYSKVTNTKGILGIDIGEGTTDVAVFNDDGSGNHTASRSVPWGFGNVLNAAIDRLQQRQLGVNTRPQLKRILNHKSTFLKVTPKQKMVKKAINEQEPELSHHIVSAMSETLRSASTDIQIIYVYGGGAIPMEYDLRNKLAQKTKSFGAGIEIPIIFISAAYAQKLNVLGLQEVLTSLLR